jgi:hypothetical protein
MAKFNYNKATQTALKLIDKFGDDTAKLLEPSMVLADPLQAWLGFEAGNIEYDTVIALDTLTNKEKSYLPDTLATKTVKRAYMEDVILTAVPQLGWQIKHNDELWTIATIADLKPNTTNVFYDMIVMK